MPLTQSGLLRGMIIAAKFNASVPVGWPELQVIRSSRENNSQRIAFRTNTTVPRPTEYLNVYKYELPNNFDVQTGDVLNISWHGDVTQPDQIRFSLAYYNNGISSRVPMVSIVVGDCDPDTDLLTLDSLYCKETTVPTTGSTNITEMVTANSATSGTVAASSTQISTVTKMSYSTTMNRDGLESDSETQPSPSSTTASTSAIIGVVVACSLLLTVLFFFFSLYNSCKNAVDK